MIKEFEKRGIKERIVIDERHAPNETDYNTYVAKVRAKEIDGIVLMIMPEPIVSIVKHIRKADLKCDIIGAEMYEDQSVLDGVGDMLLGQWFVNADDATIGFNDGYKKIFGSLPGFGSANAYDSFNMLIEAGLQNNLREIEIAKYLASIKDYKGASGEYSATGDNRFTIPAAIKVVGKNGPLKLH